MRVIAGSYGGRLLRAPRGRQTRPTSDRVKEAIFSMLGSLDGALALDLFAGTGALGIEALSRGAERVVFVERDTRALEVLGENLAALGIDAERFEVRRVDAVSALRTALGGSETYDLLLIDPPYAQTRQLAPALSQIVPAVLAPGGRVVLESDRRAQLELDLGLDVERRRRYGDTAIAIYRQR